MGYYEDKVSELKNWLLTIQGQKEALVKIAKEEEGKLDQKMRDCAQIAKEEGEKLDQKIRYCHQLEEGINNLAKERQIGFPWLAKAYDEMFALHDKKIEFYLKGKRRPAERGAEVVKEQTKLRRKAEAKAKIAEYLVSYYENIAPFLIELKEELDLPSEEDREVLAEYTADEREDKATNYLSKEEYRKLPSCERNQMALDRFWKRPKSKWLIGRLYERYVGYLYEQQGYEVDYAGIFKGYEDLGRDLICAKANDLIVVQCKNWAQFRTIYEKHIFQFFGTVFQYKDENPGRNVSAVFYTTTKLSDLARRFAKELSIRLEENHKFEKNYPCIKCNISKANGEKIYHLPFDQQYDKVKVEKDAGEFYCAAVKEAEDAGFRRAYRWRGDQ